MPSLSSVGLFLIAVGLFFVACALLLVSQHVRTLIAPADAAQPSSYLSPGTGISAGTAKSSTPTSHSAAITPGGYADTLDAARHGLLPAATMRSDECATSPSWSPYVSDCGASYHQASPPPPPPPPPPSHFDQVPTEFHAGAQALLQQNEARRQLHQHYELYPHERQPPPPPPPPPLPPLPMAGSCCDSYTQAVSAPAGHGRPAARRATSPRGGRYCEPTIVSERRQSGGAAGRPRQNEHSLATLSNWPSRPALADNGSRRRSAPLRENVSRVTRGYDPGSEIRLAPEVARAATALRAEGKELLHVLHHLRERCGAATLRAGAGREVTIRLVFGSRGTPPERPAVFRLAHAAGLKRPEVLPAGGGVRVCFMEEYAPSADDPQLPRKLHAHAHALHDALRGHHERAVAFFGLLAEHHLGPDVACHVERTGHMGTLPPSLDGEAPDALPAYDLSAGPLVAYPHVPPLHGGGTTSTLSQHV